MHLKQLSKLFVGGRNLTVTRLYHTFAMPTYPGLDIAPRDESVQDDYHGTKITDHYRWLEDPQSEPTKKWIDAQVKVWDQYLNEKSENSINREQAIKDLTEMMNYEKVGIPSKKGKNI
jgi:prolyl oligopeptidase